MEERILEILKNHRGLNRAITGRELARIIGESDDRHIRSDIRELRAQGFPIASSTKLPYGYFIVETLQEANDFMQQLKNRLIENALTRRDFKRAIAKSFNGAGQIKMF